MPTSVWKQKAKKKRQEKAMSMKNSTRMGEDETKSLNSIDFWSDGSSEEGEITSLQPTSSLHLSRRLLGKDLMCFEYGSSIAFICLCIYFNGEQVHSDVMGGDSQKRMECMNIKNQ